MTPSSELHCSPVGPAQLGVAEWELPVAEGIRAKSHSGGPDARTAPPPQATVTKPCPWGSEGLVPGCSGFVGEPRRGQMSICDLNLHCPPKVFCKDSVQGGVTLRSNRNRRPPSWTWALGPQEQEPVSFCAQASGVPTSLWLQDKQKAWSGRQERRVAGCLHYYW